MLSNLNNMSVNLRCNFLHTSEMFCGENPTNVLSGIFLDQCIFLPWSKIDLCLPSHSQCLRHTDYWQSLIWFHWNLMILKLLFFSSSWLLSVYALLLHSQFLCVMLWMCVRLCRHVMGVHLCVYVHTHVHTHSGEVGELLALIPFYNNAKSDSACQTLLASGVVWHAQDYSSGKRLYSPLIWSEDVSFC